MLRSSSWLRSSDSSSLKTRLHRNVRTLNHALQAEIQGTQQREICRINCNEIMQLNERFRVGSDEAHSSEFFVQVLRLLVTVKRDKIFIGESCFLEKSYRRYRDSKPLAAYGSGLEFTLPLPCTYTPAGEDEVAALLLSYTDSAYLSRLRHGFVRGFVLTFKYICPWIRTRLCLNRRLIK